MTLFHEQEAASKDARPGTIFPAVSRSPDAPQNELPERFLRWFALRGWAPRAHQLKLLARAREGRSVLLIAPTGAGKTLAGFLPTLVELSSNRNALRGLHTLYISPLKALAVDVARNLERPAAEMELPVRIETRTGDTPASRRQRQRRDPPDILLTTPEQIALLLASADAPHLFRHLRRIVLDELHALAGSKRGDLLALGLARLRALAPEVQTVGLSATVADPDTLRRWLVPQRGANEMGDLVVAEAGAAPDLSMLDTARHLPWAGHSAVHALGEVYQLIKVHKTTLVFVNTRMQAELLFQELWRINDDNLPIALHHGSLDVAQRRRVEAAMAEGRLKAVVCTSSLDLGIDWGDVDQVINVGAPKGSSRLMQRIGRANHRLDEPSRAVLVPSNRFEVLECRAAMEAVRHGEQDSAVIRSGGLDVLAQHVLGMACGSPFDALELYHEINSAEPYADLDWETFEQVVDFVATGGYALRAYERFARIRRMKDGRWRVANPTVAQQYRLNVGTIVEATMMKVRLAKPKSRYGGRVLGEVEEYFVETMSPGDTFVFAGEVLEYQAIIGEEVYVQRTSSKDPRVPSYEGGKFPLSTFLASRVRAILASPERWSTLPDQVHEWLAIQQERSRLPGREDLLVETFPRGDRHYLVAYPFEGRLAHQTLGMLLTRRLERARLRPLGFVANDYALAVYGMSDLSLAVQQGRLDLDALLAPDILGDDLEEWLAEAALMKRTFRQCAVIAGLIERRFPGKEKNSRQVTMSTDLIYDVLRSHEPQHLLLRAARADAATGLLDIRRLSDMLARIKGRIDHVILDHVSPLAVPAMLEIGRETIHGEAADALLAETEAELVREAMGAGRSVH
jgi:ATP-dependent Lhr-like helicase